jgi:hypothetical protein
MTNQDSLLLMDIYKRYLAVTDDMITILQRNYKALDNGDSEEKDTKREEFIEHAQATIESFNEDLHKLMRIAWELKGISE